MGRTEYIGETIEVYQGENNERVYCGYVGEAFCSLAYCLRRFNMLFGVTEDGGVRRRANLRKAWMTKTITVRFGYP